MLLNRSRPRPEADDSAAAPTISQRGEFWMILRSERKLCLARDDSGLSSNRRPPVLLPGAPGPWGPGCNGISVNVISRRALQPDHGLISARCDETTVTRRKKKAEPEASFRVVFAHLGGSSRLGKTGHSFGVRVPLAQEDRNSSFFFSTRTGSMIIPITHVGIGLPKYVPLRGTFLISQPPTMTIDMLAIVAVQRKPNQQKCKSRMGYHWAITNVLGQIKWF